MMIGYNAVGIRNELVHPNIGNLEIAMPCIELDAHTYNIEY